MKGLFTLGNGFESFKLNAVVGTKPTFFLLHSGVNVFAC